MLRCLGAPAIFVLGVDSYAQDAVALVERVHRATAVNSIDDSPLKPWHLKMSFQLYDAKGNPTERGTIEEWWAEPSKEKTVYTSPSYTSTEIRFLPEQEHAVGTEFARTHSAAGGPSYAQ
jgi:hypothetical protein